MQRRAFLAVASVVVAACTSTSGLTSPDDDKDAGVAADSAATTDASADAASESAPDAASEGGANAYREAVVADGPVGYWRFDEATGIKAKDEVGGHDGTYQGAVTLGEPAPAAPGGTAIRFAGTNGSVPVGPFLDFGGKTEITLEAWVNLDVIDTDFKRVVAKRDGSGGYSIFCQSSAAGCSLELGKGGTMHVCYIALTTGAWYHIVGTYDGATMRGYLNGAEVCNKLDTFTIGATPTAQLVFGQMSGTGNPLKGAVDEIAIYEKALSAARVKAHFDAMGFVPK